MKPDTRTAMRQLIVEVRERIPFTQGGMSGCPDSCQGCSEKLLAYLSMELGLWEARLNNGEQPRFGDISRLAKTSRKIYQTLKKNGVVG